MREESAPIEFAPLKLSSPVYKKTPTEYATACPKCGGKDRFILKMNSKTTGEAFAFCRQCNYKWWSGKDNDWRPTEEEIQTMLKLKEQRERQAYNEWQQSLAELQAARKWAEYHRNLERLGYEDWNKRGIAKWVVDALELGIRENFPLWEKDGDKWRTWHTSKTLSIPIWDAGRTPQNIKHRLLDLPQREGEYRYRYEKSNMGDPALYCTEETKGVLWLCEGEIKAMRVWQEIIQAGIQVIGTASAHPSEKTLSGFDGFDPIYYIPDPDSFEKKSDGWSIAGRVTQQLGRDRVRIIRLPDKVDDMINAGIIDRFALMNMKNYARRY